MRPSICRLFPLTILIGVLVSTTAAATPTFSRDGAAPTVRAVAVHGDEIVVTVSNAAPQTARQTVLFRVITTEGETDMAIPVTVSGGGTAQVTAEASAPVLCVLPLGVVLDDGVPF
jgi:hypothetical protein